MKISYGAHYDADYWRGKKVYHDANGKQELYHGPSLAWEGFSMVADALTAILPKDTLLDVGCGGGDLARRLRDRGFDSYGVDISDYAIEHAAVDMRDRLHICDISQSPTFPPHFPETFKTVMATDLLEHIFEEDLEQTFNWILKHTEKWLFFCVATVSEGKQEFVAKKGEPILHEWEGTAVAGHVNVRKFSYWLKFFKNQDRVLKVDWRRMYLFQMRREFIGPWRGTPGWNMQTTFVLEAQ